MKRLTVFQKGFLCTLVKEHLACEEDNKRFATGLPQVVLDEKGNLETVKPGDSSYDMFHLFVELEFLQEIDDQIFVVTEKAIEYAQNLKEYNK